MAANFYDLYRLGLSRKGWSCSELARQMTDRRYVISERTLQRYKRGETLPSLQAASEIFDTLDIEASQDYLKTMLAEQIPEYDAGYGRNRYINKSVRLELSTLSNRLYEDGAIMVALQKRIVDTQRGDNPSFNRYVAKLIQKDIDEKILPTVRRGKSKKGEKL